MSVSSILLVLVSLTIGAFLGAAAVGVRMVRKLTQLETEKASLSARLESEKATLGDHFKALAQTALQSNSESFITLANEKLKAAQVDGLNQMERKNLEIEKLVKPIEKELVRLNALSEEIKGTDKTLREDILSLRHETSKLSGVLRNPAAQGRWGEFVLETILEKANMQKGIHYNTQVKVETGRRPDVIINLHDGFKIAIDSKAPINEFLSKLDNDLSVEDIRDIHTTMARAVRSHVKALSARAYQDSMEGSDFVILFLPSEAVFSATLRADPDLVDYAADNNVVIASPTLIISLLRVVGLSWRQVELAKNAEKIASAGAELHKRLCVFMGHFGKIGKAMGSALSSYNDAVGSFDRSVLPSASKFEKLQKIAAQEGASTLPPLPTQEASVRRLSGVPAALETENWPEEEECASNLDFLPPALEKSAHG